MSKPNHPIWCSALENDPTHRSTPVTTWNANGVQVTMSIRQRYLTDAQPIVVVVVMSRDGVTTLEMPLDEAQGMQVGLFSQLIKIDQGTTTRRRITSNTQTRVKTITVRDGRKVLAKRVALIDLAEPDEPILSLLPDEAKALSRRLSMEATAIEGGIR